VSVKLMRDYDREIEAWKNQVITATAHIAQLELERAAYLEQQQRRLNYLSSREILELLEARHGRVGSMATIKRWADSGALGEVIDEREAFPLLVNKQGNKRFLYPREDVLHFLREKGYLRPRYEVLDRVLFNKDTRRCPALIIAIEPCGNSFTYHVQLEATGELLTHVAEEDLLRP